MSDGLLTEEKVLHIALMDGSIVNPAEMSLSQLIDEMKLVRDERSRLSERDSQLHDIWRGLEALLIAACDKQGMKRVANDTATATITEEKLPNVVDWDAAHKYMLENNALHLLQRRISAAAYRELQDAGIELPGVVAYTQRKVALRKK